MTKGRYSRLLRRNSVLGVISLLMLMVGFPFTHAAQTGTDAAQSERAAQSAQSDAKPKATRPLAISKLTTSGISAAQRMALKPKYAVTKPAKTHHTKGLRRNVVVVKFVDGARIREERASADRRVKTDRGTLMSRLESLKPQLATLDEYDRDLLKRRSLTPDEVERQMRKARDLLKARDIVHWRKVFEIDDGLLANFRINAEIRRKRQSSDLANYYVFKLQDGEQGEQLVDRLNELDVVELAYLAPIPVNADIPPTTASFQKSQDYLNPAPEGIDAIYAWTIPGGTGSLVKIIDIENGWNLNHEDLPSLFIGEGRFDDSYDSRQHGTAVLGVMLGRQDGIGVTGIVPNASGGAVSVNRGLGITPWRTSLKPS